MPPKATLDVSTVFLRSARKYSDIEAVCAHAAFQNPMVASTARPRESFECLSVVIFPKGTAGEDTREEVRLS
jgi:hypothetical protein